MSNLWSDFVHALTPYVPGEQPQRDNLVKLNTNENPFAPAPGVAAAIEAASGDSLRLYPDPESRQLKNVIADYFSVSDDNIFLGNGSDEVLAHAFNAFFRRGRARVEFADITYSFYPVYCDLYGIDYRQIPLQNNFSIDTEAFSCSAAGVVIANPNAPTGIALSRSGIASVLERIKDAVVIVDEAYIDFGGESAVALVEKYPNLLVVQTLSKSRSLAGLRLGYAIGSSALVDALQRVKNCFNSYPVDRLAEAAAIASFDDKDFFVSTCAKVVENREQLVQGLEQRGFICLNSAANFIFASHPSRQARSLATQLREAGVLVRYFEQPRIDNFLRISVGTSSQQQKLFKALDVMGVSAGS